MTGPTTIVIDGDDLPAHDGNVAFPVGAISAPRRPWTGLLIGLLTAVVAMGAIGSRSDDEAAAACGIPTAAAAGPDPDRTHGPAAVQTRTAPVANPTAWWLLPHIPTWVDPATGMTVQGPPAPTPTPTRLPWWRLPQMALWIDPGTALRMDAEAHEGHRVADDPRRDR